MHKLIADFSRLLNIITGGEPGKTICNRMAVRFGPGCLFCKVMAKILRQETHCLEEMSAQEIVEAKRRLSRRYSCNRL